MGQEYWFSWSLSETYGRPNIAQLQHPAFSFLCRSSIPLHNAPFQHFTALSESKSRCYLNYVPKHILIGNDLRAAVPNLFGCTNRWGRGGLVRTLNLIRHMFKWSFMCSPATCTACFPTGHSPVVVHGSEIGNPWLRGKRHFVIEINRQEYHFCLKYYSVKI